MTFVFPSRSSHDGAPRPADRPWLRVTVNLHPDRPTRDGLLVIQALARDGIYHSQFVTGTSNGGLAAHPGDARWSGRSASRRRLRRAACRPVPDLRHAQLPATAHHSADLHHDLRLEYSLNRCNSKPSWCGVDHTAAKL